MLRALTTFLQKKIFLSLTVLVAVIALFYPQSASAAYENYENLFTRDSGVRVESFVVEKEADNGKGRVRGFNLRINLQFTPFGGLSSLNNEEAGEKWDYVYDIQNGQNKIFLVRFCPLNSGGTFNNDDCVIHELTYQEFAVLEGDKDSQIAGITSGDESAKKLLEQKIKWVPQAKSTVDTIISTTMDVLGTVTLIKPQVVLLRSLIGLTDTAYFYPALAQKKYLPGSTPYFTRFRDIKYNTIVANESGWNFFWARDGKIINRNETKLYFPYGANYSIDFWYRGGVVASEKETVNGVERQLNLGPSAPLSGRMMNFKTISDQSRDTVPIIYFKIGESSTFKIPNSLQETEQVNEISNNENTGSTETSGRSSNLPECSLTGGYFGGGTLVGCAAQLIYHLIYRPAAWLANIVGMLFDFFIGFSINDEAYRLEFIQNGWQVVRDFANIFFIIIMIYTGFAVALGFGKYSVKAVVGALIINALIINFSLFITRLGVDMSNILARVFYNQMTVDTAETGIGGYKPISVALISTFNPQKLMSADILTQEAPKAPQNADEEKSQAKDQNFDASGRTLLRESANETNSAEYAGFYAIVSLASAVILFFVAKMFFSVAFIFVGRVVGLYVAMIFSPLAFLTRGNVPLIGNIGKINWKDWLDNYVKDISLPPIFMFFLYIIGFLMSSSLVTALKLNAGASFFEKFVSVAIPMFIVYILIGKAKGVAEKYASETAKMVTSKIEGAGKFVGGLAVGGAVGLGAGALAMGGRGIGAIANKVQGSEFGKKYITGNLSDSGWKGKLANFTNKKLTGAQNNSFDLRDNKMFNAGLGKFGNQFGMKLSTDNAVLGALNLNKADSKGGYSAIQKKREEKRKAEMNKIQTNFDDTDEGKAAAKAHYEAILEEEFNTRKEQNKINVANKEKDKIALEEKKRTAAFTQEDIDKAKADLEEMKKTNPSLVIDRASVTRQMHANLTNLIDGLDADIDKMKKETLDDFRKEQEKKYGKVKDNKSLEQALRIRYLKNLKNDNSSTWNAVRAVLGAGIPVLTGDFEMQDNADMKAIDKLLKDEEKKLKPNTVNEKELTYTKNLLNKALEEMEKVNPSEYGKYKNKDRENDHEEIKDYAILKKMISERRAYLQIEIKDLEDKIKAGELSKAEEVKLTMEKEAKIDERKELEGALKKKSDLEDKMKPKEERGREKEEKTENKPKPEK